MQLKHILAASALLLASFSQAQQLEELQFDSPVARAVMESYNQMLASNPKDYSVLFRRANEYYNHNMMAKALADINGAIENAPAKEKDFKFQCYCLRASIHEAMGDYSKAIADLDDALELNPSNYTELYHKANVELSHGRYDAAKASFQKLQRLNSRSQEALFGLGRIAAVEGDKAKAKSLIDDAVAMTPSSPDSYIHRGEVRALLGDNAGATDDFLKAVRYAQGKDLARPVKALVDMSNTDYPTVYSSLTSAIQRSPRQGSLYYIRGMIAQSHFRFASAASDYEYVVTNNLLDNPNIYRRLAQCYYALADYDHALECADYAIGSSPNNAPCYVEKSRIKRAEGAYRQAVSGADRALAKDANYAPAMMAKALGLLDQKLLTEASIQAGDAVLASPSDPYYKMVRAWILNKYLDQPENAAKYYDDVIALTTYHADDLRSLRGFAMLLTGRTAEAQQWMEKVLADNAKNSDGEAEYYGACFYAHAGNLDKAFECMAASLSKGYADKHNWLDNNDAEINVAPMRDDARFNPLMSRFSGIFEPGK